MAMSDEEYEKVFLDIKKKRKEHLRKKKQMELEGMIASEMALEWAKEIDKIIIDDLIKMGDSNLDDNDAEN